MPVKIYSDFSDTIAGPLYGDSFTPFETALRDLVAKEFTEKKARAEFMEQAKNGYEEFLRVRRNQDIPYSELPYSGRVMKWLTPFKGKLGVQHFNELVGDFKVNNAFFEAVKIIKQELGLSSLEITIVSGTITQLIEAFLKRPDVAHKLKEGGIRLNIEATELVMDSSGVFTGRIQPIDERVYLGAPAYSDPYLIIGDNPAKAYGGFGERLLNVQSYNPQEIREKVREFKSRIGGIERNGY